MGINGFPVNFNPAQTPLFDANSGRPTNPGLRFLLQLFNRTGQGNGLPTVDTGLTAQGADQATGFVMGADWNEFTTVAAGTATVMPDMMAGADIIVWNSGAHALKIFPNLTDPPIQIDALGNNAAYSLAAGKMQWFRQTAPTQIRSMQLG